MNNKKFTKCISLIDSGSPASFISKMLLPFDTSADELIVSNFYSLGGNKLKTFGKIDCEILLNGKSKIISLFIVSDGILSQPLLLGRDFSKYLILNFIC